MTGRPRPPAGGYRWVASARPFTFVCSSLHFRLHFFHASYFLLFYYYVGSDFFWECFVCLARGADAGPYASFYGGHQLRLDARRAIIVPFSSWTLSRRRLFRCSFTVHSIPLSASFRVLCILLDGVWERPHLEAFGPGAAVDASATAAIPPTCPAPLPNDGGR
jgi:hypothetical protein